MWCYDVLGDLLKYQSEPIYPTTIWSMDELEKVEGHVMPEAYQSEE